MARGKTLKAVEEAIARLEAERAAFNTRIDGRIEGLREAMRLQEGIPAAEVVRHKRARRGDLKETVLDVVAQMGDKGVNVEECLAIAKETKGVQLVRGSVSSLLSRLKHDDVVFFDGQRYRLKQYAGPRPRHVA